MTPCLDLRPSHWDIVCEILNKHVPDRKVLAFGSRATWTAKEYSDLDLAVLGDEPLLLNVKSALTEGFSESDLPFKVDIVEWARIDKVFRDKIRREGLVVKVPSQKTESPSRPSQPAQDCQGNDLDRSLTHHRFKEHEDLEYKGWRQVSLNELIELTLSSVDKKSKDNERSVRLCNYTDVYYNMFIHANMNFMSATATENEVNKCTLLSGDVVITKDSEKHDDIGVPALVKENVRDLVCGYHLAILRPRLSKIDGTYLYYALSTKDAQRQFHAFSNGITRFGLRKYDIGQVEIPLPSLPEQRVIARILSSLDEKIDSNRSIDQTLEEIAQTLFKSWFVNFEPVRAKMDGRDTGLPKHIDDLFPDRLINAEVGEIPEGWGIKALQNCFNLTMGQSPPSSTYNEKGDGIPFFQGRSDFGFRYPQNRKFCTAPKRIAQPGDTLISVRAPVGDINLALAKCCIGRGLSALRHKSNSLSYTYYFAKALQKRIASYEGTGTVYGSINRKQFEELQILEPTKMLVKMFHTIVNPIDMSIRKNVMEVNDLVQLRETLLPKLISGRVRIK